MATFSLFIVVLGVLASELALLALAFYLGFQSALRIFYQALEKKVETGELLLGPNTKSPKPDP